jgi:adenylylsulfate kinase
MSKLFLESGIITLTAFISPFISDRNFVRNLVGHGDFLEIYCSASLEICEGRDVKGLYQKAREGKIPNYTGISSPYEEPVNPELIANTGKDTLDKSVDDVIELLKSRKIISC